MTKIAAFLGSLILVRIMSESEFGVLGCMENLYTYAYLFAGYGLNNAVFRYLVLKETVSEKKGIFDYVVSQGTRFNLAFIAILAASAFLFPHSEEFSTAHLLLPLMLLALPFQFLADTCSFSLRALFRNRAFALAAVLTVATVWGAKAAGASLLGLEGAAASWPIAYCAVALSLLLYFRRGIFPSVSVIAPEKEERKGIRSYSFQYMITNSLWALFLQNDLLMISLLTGDATASRLQGRLRLTCRYCDTEFVRRHVRSSVLRQKGRRQGLGMIQLQEDLRGYCRARRNGRDVRCRVCRTGDRTLLRRTVPQYYSLDELAIGDCLHYQRATLHDGESVGSDG
ncbi:oligosaccharide flippase family protein [Eggerthella timonensis]|uniref:oligosaccharide flippase family protein n=1 Tax=Eggerthella timonensis TaxID=1871008 RepID=UPI000C772CEE|nr:oligosaccharide flippase family protein [Eggerthella timonensis]